MGQQNENELAGQPPHGSRHKVRCVDFEMGFSNNNNPQIGLGIEIVEGPFAGQYFPTYLSFADNAAEYSIKKMRALGWKGNDFTKLESVKSEIALATFEHEEDQDRVMRCRVSWINTIGVAMKNKMSDADLSQFNRRMSALAARVGGGGDTSSDDRKLPSPPQRNGGGGGNGRDTRRNDEPPPPSDDDAPYNNRGRGRY